jgi:hypothetical protein
MWSIIKKIDRFYYQSRLRKEYTQLRIDAIEAEKTGDVKKFLVLNSRADKMLDQVICF